MAGLILVTWLPIVIAAARPVPLPMFIRGWGASVDGCTALVDTSTFVKEAEKYRLFLVCRVLDPNIDEFEDDKIAISKPFQITGGTMQILIT